jgi:putative RecB family exonuclease
LREYRRSIIGIMAKPRKLRLSPTRVGTFLACRAMYKFDYIDKIGRFYHKSRAGNSFGATLHQVLHDFHVAGGAEQEDAQTLAQRASDSWRSAGYADAAQDAHYQELAQTLLHNYHRGELDKVGHTRVYLAEKAISLDMGDFVLTGRIDRIDEHLDNGALEIVDYKSGRSGVTAEDVENALAMCVYQLILKRLHPERRVMASIHALQSGDVATVELSDEQLVRWEDDLTDIGRRIIETDWQSVRPIYLEDVCPGCDFLALCERYWRKQAREQDT